MCDVNVGYCVNNASTVMRKLVMPISGQHFVNQVASCLALVRNGYCPDLILGTSGGSIAGALLLACDVRSVHCEVTYREFEQRIYEKLSRLTADHYRAHWNICEPIATLVGFAKGSMYDRGCGVDFLIDSNTNLKQQPELIIGTHNITKQCCYLFSTKSRHDSMISKFDDSLNHERDRELKCSTLMTFDKIKYEEMKYLDYNVDSMIRVTTASCAVPMVVPPVKIDCEEYVDGGVSYASPLGPCMSSFLNHLSYHIVYISPVRYSKDNEPEGDQMEEDNVWSKIGASLTGMVTGLHLADRNNGIRMVTYGIDESRLIRESGCGDDALRRALSIQPHCFRSFIELAPLVQHRVNFLEMQSGDVSRIVQKSHESGFSVHHWYIPYQTNPHAHSTHPPNCKCLKISRESSSSYTYSRSDTDSY